jgi:Putative prokaryotic signal transducing protein
MTAGLVHLTFVPNEYEAEILCALLRTEGLTCDQRSTNLSVGRMDGMPGGGPQEIVVAEQDLGRAQEILAASRTD